MSIPIQQQHEMQDDIKLRYYNRLKIPGLRQFYIYKNRSPPINIPERIEKKANSQYLSDFDKFMSSRLK